MVSAGKNIIFCYNNGYKQRLVAQSQNEDNFPTFSLGLKLLQTVNEAEKAKNNGEGDSASASSRFASLSEGEMPQILTERHSGKTKQKTKWSVSIFKGKRKFFRFEIVKLKLELSIEKFK